MARATEEELNTALEIFNAGLARTAAARKAERAVEKAEKAKQDAADALKKIQGNDKASADEKAAAEATYRAAVDAFNALRAGDAPPEESESEDEAEAAEPEPEAEAEAEVDQVAGEPSATPDTES
jgi:hypothetical protein